MNANECETQDRERGAAGDTIEAARVPMFAHAAIVGVGMMGGSLGLALRGRSVARRVVGVDLDAASLVKAQARGAIDEGVTRLAAGVANADVVILAAPVGVIPALLQSLVPLVRPDALITDIGSAKRHIVAVGEACFGPRFVGGHPMAGSPQGGIDAALPDLFRGAAWAVVRSQMPDEDSDPFVRQAANLARGLGARPILLDSAAHDRTVALVSHLPHVLSFAFADMVAGSDAPALAHRMAGSSFHDMLRVSTSDRAFWRDIFASNREEALAALDLYEARLRQARTTLLDGEE